MVQRRIRLSDIGEHAGVTAATVSYVLSNNQKVSIKQETRKKVIKAARDLGYQQNYIAKSLRTNKSYMIGVLIPKNISYYLSGPLAGAEETLRSNDYLCSLLDIEQTNESEYALELCHQKRIDGLLVFGGLDKTYQTRFLNERIPIVHLGWVSDDKRLTMVTGDDNRCGELASEHLISHGLKDIVFFTGANECNIANKKRISGIRDSLIANGLTERAQGFVFECGWSSQCGYDGTKELLAQGKCPEAIICYSDNIAYGVLRALAESKVSVPDEVSVVGIDDASFSGFTYPPLTSVKWPRNEIGNMGAQMLLEMINSKDSHFVPRQIFLEPELVIRESTLSRSELCKE